MIAGAMLRNRSAKLGDSNGRTLGVLEGGSREIDLLDWVLQAPPPRRYFVL